MKNNLQDEKIVLERRICDIISASDYFICQTEKINEVYKKSTKDKNILAMHSVLYFSYVLSLFKTLFEKKCSNPTEQSFERWRKCQNNISAEESDFQVISDLYKKSNFKKFRNKITDHKDYNKAGDILANFLNIIKDDHIKVAKQIVEALIQYIEKYFHEETIEYNFKSFYDKDAKIFMNILKDYYEK